MSSAAARALILIAAVVMAAAAELARGATADEDRRAVSRLDREFQAAVKTNDAGTMERILHKDMVLVLGTGVVTSREDLLQEARQKAIDYELQDEDPGTQTVRVWGDTAVVTALLWAKGISRGVPFDRRLWFSDTYVRTPAGWRCAFAQASLRLPDAPSMTTRPVEEYAAAGAERRGPPPP